MNLIAIGLSVINIFLLIFFLIKFKQLFSTDSLIESTRASMDNMIRDLNNNAQMDIDLLNDASKKLKDELRNADLKMQLFQEAAQRLRDMISEADKINKYANQKMSLYQDFNKISTAKPSVRSNIQAYQNNIDPEARFRVTANSTGLQQDLFEQEEKSIIKDEINVTSDGAAYREVPLIITKVLDEVPEKQEKTLPKKVEELYNQGMTVEHIATALSCSVTEVQLIINLL